MCEYIVQHALSTDFLGLLVRGKTLDSSTERATLSTLDHSSHPVTTSVPCDRKSVIKPNMQVSAIRQRDGQLECIKVRWGWSPVWSMGTLPPRTHLPLHLVMRSKVFDRMRGEGRVLVNWSVADLNNPHLAILWRETGGPSVAQPERRGFGSRLIERNVRHDLAGTVQMHYRDNGLSAEITIPLNKEAA